MPAGRCRVYDSGARKFLSHLSSQGRHWLGAERVVCKAEHPKFQGGPPEAPPIDITPPPPPVPPPPVPPPPSTNPLRSLTKRQLGFGMLIGSGLWYAKNSSDYLPNAKFFRTPDTPKGFTMMVSEGGTIFAVTLVRNKATGRESLFMLDAYGNIYYDSGDRNQGLYIVDTSSNLLSVRSSETEEGKIEYTRVGNLKDVKRLEIEGVADLKLGEGGDVVWAFVDDDEPLVINPGALLSKDDKGNDMLMALPAEIDEGEIEVLEEKKSIWSMFGGKPPKLTALKPDY